MKLADKDLKKNDPLKAIILYNLALIYRIQKKFVKATPLLKRSIEIGENNLGATHPDLANYLALMGALYMFQDEDNEAIQYMERAVEIWKYSRSSKDPIVITTYENLVKLYNKTGKPEEAARAEDYLNKMGVKVEEE